MQLGELEIQIINDGTLWLDGGAMFGVVPRPLWEKRMAPDDRNRIRLAMNCLLVRTGGKLILLETGAGDKWDSKLRGIYGFSEKNRLPDQLLAAGVRPEQIDMVINTHLHFDHCGWNTRVVDGKARPMFPNARYIVQAGEMAHARHPSERDQASYLSDNFLPLEGTHQWHLIEGDIEIVPGIRLIRLPGHTMNMQGVLLSGEGKTVIFPADLIPTRAHVPLPWIMGYDLYPMTTLQTKKKWISEIVRNKWMIVFGHDVDTPAAYLRERNGVVEVEPAGIC
ncbi:MAG TPA: MBL fold metallo-hydrolase [Candidatus Dormibacteraeota bacterium]|nr:MBL fold metallo-hydrolase [Candidatus Dormibacteraeota bacterium]